MKKIYSLVLGLSVLSVIASAQSMIAPNWSETAIERSGKQGPKFEKGAVYWTSNFDTPADWVAEADDETHGWLITATEKGWSPNTTINSTSGGNYALFRNGNPNTPDNTTGVEWSLSTAQPIDLSGKPSVAVTYEIWGRRFTDDIEVQFSLDGTEWITADAISDDIRPLTSTQPVNDFTNPTLRYALLAGAGNQPQVWIRFRWFSTDSRNIAYSYNIDDVSIVEAPGKEIAISDVHSDNGGADQFFEYGELPLSQAHMLINAVMLSNNGGATQAVKVVLNVTKDGAPFGTYSPAESVVMGPATDSAVTFNSFIPTEIGNYFFTYTITSDSAGDEASLGDNVAVDSLIITNNVWSDDDGNIFKGNGYKAFKLNGSTTEYAPCVLGQSFQVYNSGDKAYGIYTVIPDFAGSIVTLDQPIYVDLHRFTDPATYRDNQGFMPEEYVTIPESHTEYNIAANDITPQASAPNTRFIKFDQAIDLLPGIYVATISTLGGSDFIYNIPITSNDNGDLSGSLFGDIQPNVAGKHVFYGGMSPYIKLALAEGKSDGLNKTASTNFFLGQNQPNPFNGTSTVSYQLKEAGSVNFEVMDVTGKVVKSVNEGVKTVGNHAIVLNSADFNAGVYFYTLNVNGVKVSKKMIITE